MKIPVVTVVGLFFFFIADDSDVEVDEFDDVVVDAVVVDVALSSRMSTNSSMRPLYRIVLELSCRELE